LTVHSFENLDGASDEPAHVDVLIAGEVLRLGQRPEGVVYAVPGHPCIDETSVTLILAQAREASQAVDVIEGLSVIGSALGALQVHAVAGLQVHEAAAVAACDHAPINPDSPALLIRLNRLERFARLKRALMNQYPDDHSVALVRAAGIAGQPVVYLPLCKLESRDDLDATAVLYIPPLPTVSSFEGLQDTVAHLRAPDGCPWDREQTHESLRTGLTEEAYEALAAIDAGDMQALQEELGDLLLQIALHAQIATEAGEFKMAQVIGGIDSKLKYRHPHVWGARMVTGTQEVLRRWEELKRKEKGGNRSALDGVPLSLPALQQADTYSRRAARVGFDWTEANGVVEKVREEMAEVETAVSLQEQEAELGDLLFAVVNWARWLGVDPETALRKANARFARRFQGMERMALQRGIDLMDLTIDELEALWQESKKGE
jgi:tetrapyrrole methylase family protein/MazG family protein